MDSVSDLWCDVLLQKNTDQIQIFAHRIWGTRLKCSSISIFIYEINFVRANSYFDSFNLKKCMMTDIKHFFFIRMYVNSLVLPEHITEVACDCMTKFGYRWTCTKRFVSMQIHIFTRRKCIWNVRSSKMENTYRRLLCCTNNYVLCTLHVCDRSLSMKRRTLRRKIVKGFISNKKSTTMLRYLVDLDHVLSSEKGFEWFSKGKFKCMMIPFI